MLKLRDVAKRYAGMAGEVDAVSGVSLEVKSNEMVAACGPSGCGKTTLLLMSGGLLRPTAGEVLVAETNPYHLSPGQRSDLRARLVGFVFQQFHLLSYLDVLQNVMTPNVPNPQPDPKGRADELIRHFHLEHRIHQRRLYLRAE